VTDSPPDPLARAADELGDPDAVYAVGPARAGVKLLAALALVAYGVVANALWWGVGPARFDHLVLLVLFAPPLSGVSMLRHLARARGTAAAAYPTGLLLARGREVESYPWAETEVALRADRGEVRAERDAGGRLTACWVAVEPPLVKFWQAGLTVRRADGAEATLTPAVAGYADLAERVQRGTFAARWPDLLGRIAAGERRFFGGFLADATGVWHGESHLAWDHVGKVEIAQGKLTVKAAGKWLPWAVAELADVPDPHLLLALAEEMRPGAAPA
jgi:hypothetical protein